MEFAWEQIGIFLRAIAVGAGIMACYDVFRMLRTAFRTADAVVFWEDIVFFAAAGMATWFYLLESCRGELRGFVMVGELLGGVLYFLTLGSLVMKIARPVIHFIHPSASYLSRHPNPIYSPSLLPCALASGSSSRYPFLR